VIGLGSGAVTCYGEAGQRMTFFEIDPVVVAFASDPRHFSYVSECGGARPNIVLGDARLTLAREPDEAFSLLLMDAFSSDAIPVHLATKEALQLYLQKLAPGGVIAFHISNRYIDLAPVLAAITRELGLVARISDDSGLDEAHGRATMRYPANWVAIARDAGDLGTLWTADNWRPVNERRDIEAWTDDFSNILSVLVFRTRNG
jgi:spermidine synthase